MSSVGDKELSLQGLSIKGESNAPEVGRKDSVDRFGDALTQRLLSYLALEDRFRLECVSKRFQRVVYEPVTDLIIGDHLSTQLNDKSFESILKKCKHITRIELTVNNSRLESIVKHCPQLAAIDVRFDGDISDEIMDQFFATFAKQLKSIKAYILCEYITVWKCLETNLKSCAEVTKIAVQYDYHNYFGDNLLHLMSGDDNNEVLFPKLKAMDFVFAAHDINHFETFVRNYGQRLTAIEVTVDERNCDDKAMAVLLGGVSRMPALKDLKITSSSIDSMDSLPTQLKQIGLNCAQLKRLSLDLNTKSNKTFRQTIQTINDNYRRIRRLEFSGNPTKEFVLMSDSFNGLTRLSHLTLLNVTFLFVNQIHDSFPRLQYLRLRKVNISDDVLELVSKLPQMRTIRLDGGQDFADTALHQLIASCLKIVEISMNSSVKTV
jgi:hypothetical protein